MKKLILLFAFVFIVASCGKKDERPNTQNQGSTQNVAPSTTPNQVDANNKWMGSYTFEESAKNVAGDGAQTWNYVVTVKAREDKTLAAEIQVDGFQTMTRIEADVKAEDMSADFIFSRYLPDNMFEVYKKGDRLFTLKMNEKNEVVTDWDKMKPNVTDNRKSGRIMFKRVSS